MAKRRPSGDGMVRKREDGRWEGRIVIGHKDSGEPIFRYVSAKTQKGSTEKLHQNIEEYRDVDLCEDSKMSLGNGWTAGWRSTRPIGAALYLWRDTAGTSSETSSHIWGTSRWERSPQRTSGGCTGRFKSTGVRRSTPNTGTSWRALRSAASTAFCMKLWMRRCKRT